MHLEPHLITASQHPIDLIAPSFSRTQLTTTKRFAPRGLTAPATVLCSPPPSRSSTRTRWVTPRPERRSAPPCHFRLNVDSGVQDQHHEAIDEDAVQDAHHQVYEKGSGGNLPASSLGSAAALQVRLAKFSSNSPHLKLRRCRRCSRNSLLVVVAVAAAVHIRN
jgi:hypothetical protein